MRRNLLINPVEPSGNLIEKEVEQPVFQIRTVGKKFMPTKKLVEVYYSVLQGWGVFVNHFRDIKVLMRRRPFPQSIQIKNVWNNQILRGTRKLTYCKYQILTVAVWKADSVFENKIATNELQARTPCQPHLFTKLGKSFLKIICQQSRLSYKNLIQSRVNIRL